MPKLATFSENIWVPHCLHASIWTIPPYIRRSLFLITGWHYNPHEFRDHISQFHQPKFKICPHFWELGKNILIRVGGIAYSDILILGGCIVNHFMRKGLLRIWNDFKRSTVSDHLSNDMSALCRQVTGASSPRDHDRVKSDSMEKSSNKRGQMFLFRSRYPSSARRAIYPRQGPHLSQFHFGDADVTSYNAVSCTFQKLLKYGQHSMCKTVFFRWNQNWSKSWTIRNCCGGFCTKIVIKVGQMETPGLAHSQTVTPNGPSTTSKCLLVHLHWVPQKFNHQHPWFGGLAKTFSGSTV